MTTLFRTILMGEEIPTGDKAVFAFFEIFAVGFTCAGAEKLISSNPQIALGSLSLIIAAFLCIVGLGWGPFRRRLKASPLVTGRWSLGLMIVLTIAAFFFVVSDRIFNLSAKTDTPQPQPQTGFVVGPPAQSIYDHHYHFEAVPIDGTAFYNCTFDGVTFVYSGAAGFSFQNCKFTANCAAKTTNQAVQTFMVVRDLVEKIGAAAGGPSGHFEEGFYDQDGNLLPIQTTVTTQPAQP